MNVKVVTVYVKKNRKLAGSSHPNRTGKQATKMVTFDGLNLKKIWLKSKKKSEGENKGVTKDINDMRAVINT